MDRQGNWDLLELYNGPTFRGKILTKNKKEKTFRGKILT